MGVMLGTDGDMCLGVTAGVDAIWDIDGEDGGDMSVIG